MKCKICGEKDKETMHFVSISGGHVCAQCALAEKEVKELYGDLSPEVMLRETKMHIECESRIDEATRVLKALDKQEEGIW